MRVDVGDGNDYAIELCHFSAPVISDIRSGVPVNPLCQCRLKFHAFPMPFAPQRLTSRHDTVVPAVDDEVNPDTRGVTERDDGHPL